MREGTEKSNSISPLTVKDDTSVKPSRPPFPALAAGGAISSVHSNHPKPTRPKERYKTLSSQYPMVELRTSRKNEMESSDNYRSRHQAMMSSVSVTDNQDTVSSNLVSAIGLDSLSPKPLIKPKPQVRSIAISQNSCNKSSTGEPVTAAVKHENKLGINQQIKCEREVTNGNQQCVGEGNYKLCTNQGDASLQDTSGQSVQKETGHQSTSDHCSGENDTQQDESSLDYTCQQKINSDEPCTNEESNVEGGNQEKTGDGTGIPFAVNVNLCRQEVDAETGFLDTGAETVFQSPATRAGSLSADEGSGSLNIGCPVYAQVDKMKKLKRLNVVATENIGKRQPSRQAPPPPQVAGNKIFSHQSDATGDCPVVANAVPPKKPPRTFAHSEYLRLKMEGSEKKTKRVTTESDYEEIGIPQETKQGDQSNRNSCHLDSTEPAKTDLIKRRSTGDKLPAPPRPPPPTILNKTGTLPSKKSLETTGLSDEMMEGVFVRGMANLRSSERSYFKKGTESSSSKSQEVKRSSNVRSGSLSEESIYADPDDVKNDDVFNKNIPDESPNDDPLYEVPSLVNKCRSSSHPLQDTKVNTLRQMSTPPVNPSAHSTFSKASHDTRFHQRNTDTNLKMNRNRPTHGRISSAYSILRLNIEATESGQEDVDEDSDSEVTKDEQDKRLKHISNVRKHTSQFVANYVKLKLQEPNHLFEFALIVGLNLDENKKCHPQILYQYPEKLTSEMSSEKVEFFCFPDAEIWRPVSIYDGEMFSFLLTNELGMRHYGFCRRLLPPGSGNRLPAALCIVSSIGEVCMYEQLLRAVTERYLMSTDLAQDLLCSAYVCPCPLPNKEVHINPSLATADGKRQSVILRRAGESRPDNVSCDVLLSYISTNILIKIFGSVLLERRLVFCAQKLSTLTSCIHTILALLYPFEWQHVFIPVLPSCMTDVLDSPTPYIIGIMSSTYAKLLQLDSINTEVLVIDLDGGSLLRSYGDEEHIIPKKLQKALATALKDDSDSLGVRDATVTEAFLRFFIETCGHYTEFISPRTNFLAEFEMEQFINAVSSRSIQLFLEWFAGTQMFDVFVTEEMHGMKHELFLSRIMEYREEMREMTSSLKLNMKMMRKKIKHFFVESGGKLKRKFQRNVFI